MSFEKFIENFKSATEKMMDYAQKEIGGMGTTIMHGEVYPTEEEAKKAASDPKYRAWYSSQKEFSRRTRGT